MYSSLTFFSKCASSNTQKSQVLWLNHTRWHVWVTELFTNYIFNYPVLEFQKTNDVDVLHYQDIQLGHALRKYTKSSPLISGHRMVWNSTVLYSKLYKVHSFIVMKTPLPRTLLYNVALLPTALMKR